MPVGHFSTAGGAGLALLELMENTIHGALRGDARVCSNPQQSHVLDIDNSGIVTVNFKSAKHCLHSIGR